MKNVARLLLRLAMQRPDSAEVLRAYLVETEGAPLYEALWAKNSEGDAWLHKALRDALLGLDDAELRASPAENDFSLLKEVVAEEHGAGLRAVFSGSDGALLGAALKGEPAAARALIPTEEILGAFLEAVSEGDARILDPLLASIPLDALKTRLFEDDYALFREIALSQGGAGLRRILFENDYLRISEILTEKGSEALKSVVLDGPGELFHDLVIAREGGPLGDVLFADNARVFRDVCRNRGDAELLPLVDVARDAFRASCTAEERLDIFEECADAPLLVDALRNRKKLTSTIEDSPWWRARSALADAWKQLAPLFPKDDAQIESKIDKGLCVIQEPDHVRGRILDAVTDDGIVHLAHGDLHFPCRHSLWTLLHEILFHEDYFFPCEISAPRIIDAGTHMGMAIYYFKTLYPDARITGFEPVPYLREIAEKNVAGMGYKDVEVLPFALAESAGERTFYTSASWSMAGSLQDRRRGLGDEVTEVTVPCVQLSAYLDEPVHFLKIDIEGAEADVISEVRDKLGNVQYLFCEVHQGGGLDSDRLSTILQRLEGVNFDVQVGKSHNYQQTSKTRPLCHFDGPASMVLWARNRRWSHGGP
jgi:FkbM family methyltransferase